MEYPLGSGMPFCRTASPSADLIRPVAVLWGGVAAGTLLGIDLWVSMVAGVGSGSSEHGRGPHFQLH